MVLLVYAVAYAKYVRWTYAVNVDPRRGDEAMTGRTTSGATIYSVTTILAAFIIDLVIFTDLCTRVRRVSIIRDWEESSSCQTIADG